MKTTEVLVVGGGPAGAAAAGLLAKEGLKVRLVERQAFPRYHVGESLTPSCRYVLELLGIADRLDAGGFQIKRGGVFQWGAETWVVDWGRLFGPQVRSWQVDRAAFDQVMLEHAGSLGVHVSQGVTARRVVFDGDRPRAVECTGPDGDARTIEGFDYLVDASGRAGLLARQHVAERRPHQIFRNVAIWGYWRNGTVLPDTPEGGLNAISSPDGWYWVIPLAGDRISVGFVTHKDRFAERRRRYDSTDAMLHALVAESPTVRELVSGGQYLPSARVETDYSYVADRFSGPGHVMVGDAACFLDPLLATGVHLALYSGLVAAASIASASRGDCTEAEALGFFEYGYRRAYARLLALVSSMYERYRGKDEYFWTAQRLVQEDPAGLSAASFGEIIAGMTDLREAADASARVLTSQLVDAAREAQQQAMTAPDGTGRPDFSPLMAMPIDGDQAGFVLVTEPRLGLRRVEVVAGRKG